MSTAAVRQEAGEVINIDAAKRTPAAPPSGRPSRRALAATALALLVALGGIAWILAPGSSESTDDAYIGANTTTIAPKVRGLVAEVLVTDNQAVHAGDALVRIDAEEFDARVATARAELADAEAGVAAVHAAIVSLESERRLADANVGAAETVIRSASAQSDRALADTRRFEALVVTGAVARREADAVRAGAISAEQDIVRATALLKVARETVNVTSARRATLTAALAKADALVDRARAALTLALQDQRHALVLAPIDGVVGNRQVQQGDYVQPGTRLLTLVPLHALYVTANFEETQTARMQVGQRASVQVDALSSHPLTGAVESLAPGSGSQFALLPFEPGTGNFTKIVQRVPVRIRFDASQPDVERLRPGLSVTAKFMLHAP